MKKLNWYCSKCGFNCHVQFETSEVRKPTFCPLKSQEGEDKDKCDWQIIGIET